MRRWLLSFLICSLVVSTMACNDAERRILDRVSNLPGQPPVQFNHYAGYIPLQPQNEKVVFYWFFEAQVAPPLKPLVLWLTGGPGCSSVAFGAVQEVGPFLVERDYATNLTLNPYSWNKVANILFVESPVGVGFSYTSVIDDILNLGDQVVANDTLAFLRGWFKRFPDFQYNDFYIVGESYGGHYATQLADAIYESNNLAVQDIPINLKGILLQNAVINDQTDTLGFVEYAWSHGIISDILYGNITMDCGLFSYPTTSPKCNAHLRTLFDAFIGINIFNVYSPVCFLDSPEATGGTEVTDETLPAIGLDNPASYDPCVNTYVANYFNREDVQMALHANVTALPYPYTVCSDILTKWNDSPDTVLPIIQKLLDSGLRILAYSGDTDVRVPVTSTRNSIMKLELPIIEEWRAWYNSDQVGGWVETYVKGVTLATVRGAGHQVPAFARDQSLTLFSYFINNASLPYAGF